ncbi:MAG: sulfate/molybdate ABC transporter ATP-binding protein [Pseudonocardiaceae bacterium]
MALHADIAVMRDRFTLEVTLNAENGETIGLLGPNGSGKSTALRVLAGLLPLSGGRVELDGEVLDDAAEGVFVPPGRRAVGMVFQNYVLFPHLTALDNVAFGPRARGVPRPIARQRAEEWLRKVDVGAQFDVRPGSMSGGQAQRVALARALITEPRLLLLNEPFAALDVSTRLQVRAQLRHHLVDYPGVAVLVTHDPMDAMAVADRLLVLEDGHVVQEGLPTEIAQRPRTEYVARLVGVNLYRGTARGNTVDLVDGGTLTTTEPGTGHVLLAFEPNAVSLHRTQPNSSLRNTWPVHVRDLEERGNATRVRLTGHPDVLADITPDAAADLDLTPGTSLWAGLKATAIRNYPA